RVSRTPESRPVGAKSCGCLESAAHLITVISAATGHAHFVPTADEVQCSKQRVLLGVRPGFHNLRHSDCKGGTTTGLALDRDVATHHLTEAPADHETKAGAAVLARGGGGGLGKLLE